MTLLIQPDSLSLASNLKKFVIITASDISFRLYAGGSLLVNESYSPDAAGKVTVDVRDVVRNELSFAMPAGNIFLQENICKSFTADISGTQVSFTAIRAGVESMTDTAANFLAKNWLTWQPQSKMVSYYQPEWLSYYSQTDAVVKVRYYLKDSTSAIQVLHNIPAGTCYTYNVQFSHIMSLQAGEKNGYYDIWVENTAGERLSYIQRYVYKEAEDADEYFCFENSLGGIDTAVMDGESVFTPELTHETGSYDDDTNQLASTVTRLFSKNTGYKDKSEAAWLWDFFSSLSRYKVSDGALCRITVTESDVKESSQIDMKSYTFTYRLSQDLGLLNLVRTSEALPENLEITTPEGLFFLAPRLDDLPSAVAADSVIFPVQSAYSGSWSKMSWGQMWSILYGKVLSSPIGEVVHTHPNFSTLNKLSDEGGILKYNGSEIGGSGIKHGDLSGRSLVNQHPMSAITGLDAAMSAKAMLAGSILQDFSAKKLKSSTLLIPTSLPASLAADEWAMCMQPTGFSGEAPLPGGGASSMSELSDVSFSNLADGHAPVFSMSQGRFVNQRVSMYGHDHSDLYYTKSEISGMVIDSYTKSQADLRYAFKAGSILQDFSAKKLTGSTLMIPTSMPAGLNLGEWAMCIQPTGFSGEAPSGGGTINVLSDVGDVTYNTALANNQILQYDSTLSKWRNIMLDFTRISGIITDGQFANDSISANRILTNASRRFVTDAQIAAWNGNSITGLTGGYLPYWNGTRLVNSAIQQTDTDVFITSRNLYLDGKTNKSIKFQSLFNWYYYLGIVGNDFRFYDYDNTDFLRFSWASDKYLSLFGSMYVRNGGFVGVGYSSDPGSGNKFAVNGAGYFNGSLTAASFEASKVSALALSSSAYGMQSIGYSASGSAIFLAGQAGVTNGFTVRYDGTAMQYSFADGTVGIGMSPGLYALAVGGTGFFNGNVTASTFKEGNTLLSDKYHPLTASLSAIAALAGTSGLLRKTAADTWQLDTTNYLVASSLSNYWHTGNAGSTAYPWAASSMNSGSYLLDGISINTPGTLSNVAYKGTLSNTYLPKWDSANAKIINSIMRDDGSTVYVGGKLSASTLNAGILQIDNVSINTPGVLGNVAYKGYLSSNYVPRWDGEKLINSIMSDNGYNVGLNYSAGDCLFGIGQPVTGWGTVSNDAGGTAVNGVGTQFLNTFKVGDSITIGGEPVTITAITSNTYMLTTVISSYHSGASYSTAGGSRFRVYGNGLVQLQELAASRIRIPKYSSTTPPTGLAPGEWYIFISV